MSTSSTSSSGTVSNGRYWGLASGLDVDSIVSGLLTADQGKINKVKQQQTNYEWQQTAYQNIISKMNDFQNAYLKLGASSSMATSNMYTSFTTASTNSALITATATSDANGVSQNIIVQQSATTGTITSSKAVKGGTIQGAASWDTTLSTLQGTGADQSIALTVDGVTKTITYTQSQLAGFADGSAFRDQLNNDLKSAFGTVPSSNGGTEQKVSATTDASGTFGLATPSDYSMSLSVDASTTNAASWGLTSGQSNALDIYNTTVSKLSNGNDITFLINGQPITLNASDTISAALSKITNASAGVTATYDSAHDTISITSNQSGAAGGISISASGDASTFLTNLNLNNTDGTFASTNQQDAIVSINGTSYSRSSNKFTIGGVTYSINETVTNKSGAYTINGTPSASAPTTSLAFTNDPTTLETGIKNFISAYNTLLDAIHTQTDTKPDKNYAPLTDAQQTSMTADQITAWNTKAQAGVLFDDSALENICSQMRSALYAKVQMSDGSTFSLYQMGVTTSDDPNSYGKLEIKDTDQTKFNNACATQADKIKQLFTNSSGVSRITLNQYSTELSTSLQNGSGVNSPGSSAGLVSLFTDVMQMATGYDGIHYGSLVQIAGTSTLNTYKNTLYNYIQQEKTDISDLTDEMTTKKNRLYTQFQKLETFMEQANSQSSMISSFGSSK